MDTTEQSGFSQLHVSIEGIEYSEPGEVEKRVSVVPEPLYHVFSKEEKWTLVIMIGVAGLFSGLSSNIYFSALDAIAQVRNSSSWNLFGIG